MFIAEGSTRQDLPPVRPFSKKGLSMTYLQHSSDSSKSQSQIAWNSLENLIPHHQQEVLSNIPYLKLFQQRSDLYVQRLTHRG